MSILSLLLTGCSYLDALFAPELAPPDSAANADVINVRAVTPLLLLGEGAGG